MVFLVAHTGQLQCAPKDQSFNRQTYHRTNPKLACCLLPAGKFVVTSRWTFLGAKDCAALFLLQRLQCSGFIGSFLLEMIGAPGFGCAAGEGTFARYRRGRLPSIWHEQLGRSHFVGFRWQFVCQLHQSHDAI